jgi:hypothetical protein
MDTAMGKDEKRKDYTGRSKHSLDRPIFAPEQFLSMDAQAIDDMLDMQIQALDSPETEGNLIDQFFLNSSARDIDKEIEESNKIHVHKRRQRSENWRQNIVLGGFMLAVLLIFFALFISAWNLLTVHEGWVVERSTWVVETLVGGLIAGLIGFVAVKTYEK